MTQRLTINATSRMLEELQELTTKHRPFITRHRILRAAVAVGLTALSADPELLREVLENERESGGSDEKKN